MTPSEIERKIQQSFPGSTIQIRDLTGTKDHWQVIVVSPAFEGKRMLEQHRMIKGVFESEIASGDLHAFSLKTYTPEEWAKFA
ncbi:MAG: BolA family transcriptional regulator [Deltaproteobacteria bacterium]|nr:BolA family transcriptional regulator [Deltaproteobacteria bacterium]MBI2500158.1 BolA family transcriptional regulator [Deltaproteobacteria bacterium]MBI4196848.1 BolA family transcriptional regulator [Deltaproteobacteria bacterium]